MSMEQFGLFGAVVTIALALISTFSLMLLKMFGGMKKWAGIAGEDAPFVVKAGARFLGIAAIAATYVWISKTNYHWFLGACLLSGLIAVILLARFDRLRKLHVRQVPIVGEGAKQIGTETIVIGTEATMRDEAKKRLSEARKAKGPMSILSYLSGAGADKLYDPETCWDAEVLSRIRSHLTMLLVWISIFGVLVLYLGASSIEIATRKEAAVEQKT